MRNSSSVGLRRSGASSAAAVWRRLQAKKKKARVCKVRACGLKTSKGTQCKICISQGKDRCHIHARGAAVKKAKKLLKHSRSHSAKPSKSKLPKHYVSPPRPLSCFDRGSKKLTNVQRCIVEYINSHQNFMVALGTGSGKTLIAVTAANCYLDKFPTHKVVVVTPAGVVKNFQKEFQTYSAHVSPRIHVMSYEAFMNKPLSCHNTMMIIDEAHNMRTQKSKRFQAMWECSSHADKRVLMTATPFVNADMDIRSLVSIMTGVHPDAIPDIESALQRLQGRVKFMKANPEMAVHYPQVRNHRVFVKMSPLYEARYLDAIIGAEAQEDFENPKMFYHAYRKAVNSLGEDEYVSQKVKTALQLIGNSKTLIYSNWLKFGQKVIAEHLQQNGISYRLYNGKLTKSVRQQILDDFNADKYQVLVVSSAGGTGIDLKGVRKLIIMDPTWNNANLQQIHGRVARYRSHEHLPPDQRVVDTYELILVTSAAGERPEDGEWRHDMDSGDAVLYDIIERKKAREEQIYDLLDQMSIKC